MSRCIAWVPSTISDSLWMPCTEPILSTRFKLCAEHADNLYGIFLGFQEAGMLDAWEGSRARWVELLLQCHDRPEVKCAPIA